MARITIKNGQLSSDLLVQVKRDHVCECGAKSVLTAEWPEGLSVNGAVNFNVKCPQCGVPVTLPDGHHYVENYRLLTKPR